MSDSAVFLSPVLFGSSAVCHSSQGPVPHSTGPVVWQGQAKGLAPQLASQLGSLDKAAVLGALAVHLSSSWLSFPATNYIPTGGHILVAVMDS